MCKLPIPRISEHLNIPVNVFLWIFWTLFVSSQGGMGIWKSLSAVCFTALPATTLKQKTENSAYFLQLTQHDRIKGILYLGKALSCNIFDSPHMEFLNLRNDITDGRNNPFSNNSRPSRAIHSYHQPPRSLDRTVHKQLLKNKLVNFSGPYFHVSVR